MSYGVHITRIHPATPEPRTISLEEWLAYVNSDGEMSLKGHGRISSPKGEVIESDAPGLAEWTDPLTGKKAYFDLARSGRVSVSSPSQATLVKMFKVAEGLGAVVRGDAGEYYDASGETTSILSTRVFSSPLTNMSERATTVLSQSVSLIRQQRSGLSAFILQRKILALTTDTLTNISASRWKRRKRYALRRLSGRNSWRKSTVGYSRLGTQYLVNALLVQVKPSRFSMSGNATIRSCELPDTLATQVVRFAHELGSQVCHLWWLSFSTRRFRSARSGFRREITCHHGLRQ